MSGRVTCVCVAQTGDSLLLYEKWGLQIRLRGACRLAKVPSRHTHVPRQAGLGLPRGMLQRQPRLAQ